MTKILKLLLVLPAFLLPMSATFACSCVNLTQSELVENADVIFTGFATKTFLFGNQRLITFAPDQVIKGEDAKEIQIYTSPEASACGYMAAKGEHHLIFASKEKGKLVVTVCDGSIKEPSDSEINTIASLVKFGSPVASEEPHACVQVMTNAKSSIDGQCKAFPTPCDVPVGWYPVVNCADVKGFTDVGQNTPYAGAINWLAGTGVVSGFENDTYRPDASLGRAAFTKIIIGLLYPNSEIVACTEVISTNAMFPDVPADQWFAPYVCVAKKDGIVSGYPNGTFGPAKDIAFSGAAKMLVNAFGIEVDPLANSEWYEPYVISLEKVHAIPSSIKNVQHKINRGEMAELVWRLQNKITTLPSSRAADIFANSKSCIEVIEQTVPNVDMERVRNTWLSWHNTERAKFGLKSYTMNDALIQTAGTWSQFSADRNSMTHKRPGQTAYYDYRLITDWFANLGVRFANSNGYTYSESIGWGPWRCTKADCTDDMIAGIRQTFDFYLGEKTKASQPHYAAIVSKAFREIGMDVAVNPVAKKYFITTHYATSLLTNPPPVCR